MEEKKPKSPLKLRKPKSCKDRRSCKGWRRYKRRKKRRRSGWAGCEKKDVKAGFGNCELSPAGCLFGVLTSMVFPQWFLRISVRNCREKSKRTETKKATPDTKVWCFLFGGAVFLESVIRVIMLRMERRWIKWPKKLWSKNCFLWTSQCVANCLIFNIPSWGIQLWMEESAIAKKNRRQGGLDRRAEVLEQLCKDGV